MASSILSSGTTSGDTSMQFLDPAATRVDVWGIWFVFMIGVMMPFSVIRSVRRRPPAVERQRIAVTSMLVGLYDVIRGLLAGHCFEKLEQTPQFTNVEA